MARIRSVNDIPEAEFQRLCEEAAALRDRFPQANPYVLGYNPIVSSLPCEDDEGCDLPLVAVGRPEREGEACMRSGSAASP